MTSVPVFMSYYPSPDEMDSTQRRFYQDLITDLNAGRYRDVEGQISYLFAYVYLQIANAQAKGFGWAYSMLSALADAYAHETKFYDSCQYWAFDCLLAIGDYERFLEETELQWFPKGTMRANVRCNVTEYVNARRNPFDVLGLFGTRGLTKHSKQNPGAFGEQLESVLDDWEKLQKKPILQHLREQDGNRTYGHYLFPGLPYNRAIPIPYYCYYAGPGQPELLQALSREAENRMRDALKVPRVGEGWVSETALFREISKAFPQTTVIQHGRPKWLGRQHLDIWLPLWRVAVEYHGLQHFEPVGFFGGAEAFEKSVERDARKAALCKKASVELIVATEDTVLADVLRQIELAHTKNGNNRR